MFDFKVSTTKSDYALYINGKLWLESGPTFFNGAGQTWSTDSSDFPLVLTKVNIVSGGGATEQWKETQYTFSMGNTTDSVMAAIRLYTGSVYSSRVLFTQVRLGCNEGLNIKKTDDFLITFRHIFLRWLDAVFFFCAGGGGGGGG